MALGIIIDRNAIEEGARVLIGRRSRRAWQVVFFVICASIAFICGWRAYGETKARFEIGNLSLSSYATYTIKFLVASTWALGTLVWLYFMLRAWERRGIDDLGKLWETKAGGHGVVEILDNQMRLQVKDYEIIISQQDIRELLEGEKYSVLVYAGPVKKQRHYLPIERGQEAFLAAVKQMTPRISRSLS